METPELKPNKYDKVLFEKLKSFQGKRCKLILKSGLQVEGMLSYVDLGIRGLPFITFDMGDSRLNEKYGVTFENILYVGELENS